MLDPNAHNHGAQPQQGQNIRAFLDPLFNPIFIDALLSQLMGYSNWSTNSPKDQLRHLRAAARAIIAHAPYLLTRDWPLIFVSLFFDHNEIRQVIAYSLFQLEMTENDGIDDWEDGMNDKLVYTYLAKYWRSEARAMDDIFMTFRFCQGWISDKLEDDTGK